MVFYSGDHLGPHCLWYLFYLAMLYFCHTAIPSKVRSVICVYCFILLSWKIEKKTLNLHEINTDFVFFVFLTFFFIIYRFFSSTGIFASLGFQECSCFCYFIIKCKLDLFDPDRELNLFFLLCFLIEKWL